MTHMKHYFKLFYAVRTNLFKINFFLMEKKTINYFIKREI